MLTIECFIENFMNPWTKCCSFFSSQLPLKKLCSSLWEHSYEPLRPEDILSLQDFLHYRQDIFQYLWDLKKKYTLSFGPHMTLFVEHKFFVWWQVQEMLRIEKGGFDQVLEELETYNPLIPQKNTFVVTWMLEFPESQERKRLLGHLQGLHHHLHLHLEGKNLKTHESCMMSLPFHQCPYYLGGQQPSDQEEAHSVYFMETTLPALEDLHFQEAFFTCTHPTLQEKKILYGDHVNLFLRH